MQKANSIFRSIAAAVAGLLVTGIVLTACNKFNNDDNTNTDVAALMAFNLAPDKSQVTVALSGSALTNTPLSYTSFTGTYLRVYPGNRSVDAYDNMSNTPFASQAFTFEPNKYYSAFVTGAGSNYRNVIVWDNFDSLKGNNGKAYIRYVNAIPDSSAPVAVRIISNGTNVVNESAAFGRVNEFTAVDPGSVTIDINNGAAVDADRTITVENQKVYTVLLTGIPASGTTPVEIKYVTNGQLDASSGSRMASQGSSGKLQ